ncbi:hypothetical protein AVEN_238812-1 [Araneus ventricosus]|uniref:Uncharacterized protein n=1 Tax=Araneus ventricosus TaxID=182803 RepID=A0A4Y2HKM4_ARAVE|nr:hypothetical protein AVEN_238812-1 [Araneus ventricosus]
MNLPHCWRFLDKLHRNLLIEMKSSSDCDPTSEVQSTPSNHGCEKGITLRKVNFSLNKIVSQKLTSSS